MNFSNITKRLSPKLFIDDVKSIFNVYKGQMIRISILSGFLLFLLNILVGISLYGNTLNASLKDKLGMYFYIKDDVQQQESLYKQVYSLKDELESNGLNVNILTKDDALEFMQKRVPELTGSFEKFGITNPLPTTLYVTFADKSQYNTLQKVMMDNKEIILNIQDLDQIDNLEQQENRILNVIRLSNFIQILSSVLVIVIASVILSFAIFFIRGIFNTFFQDIQIKKLLGASKSQIISPFLRLIVYALIGGFIIAILLTLTSLGIFDYYMSQLFDFTLTSSLFANRGNIILIFISEIIAIMGLLICISYIFVSQLHKRLK